MAHPNGLSISTDALERIPDKRAIALRIIAQKLEVLHRKLMCIYEIEFPLCNKSVTKSL